MTFPLDSDIKVVTIFYFGRSGSYFLHSLLDSHPNIVSIPPGCLISFFGFWERHCHLPKNELIKSFVLEYLEMLDPDIPSSGVSYGSAIRNLGCDKNITLKADVNLFIQSLCSLLEPYSVVTRRNLFIAVHLSYHVALGFKIPEDFIIVFQGHGFSDEMALNLLNDFPSAKFLHTVRYPIQALGSHIKHHAVDQKEMGFDADYLFHIVTLTIEGGVECFPGYNKIAKAIRLEDIHTRTIEILTKLCEWLEIPWDDILLESTIAGHQFSFQSSYSGSVSGFTTATINVTHDDIYTSFDKFRFELIFKDKCQAWKYPVSSFVDDGIVEKLMLYPYKMEHFFSTDELKEGHAEKLRDYLLTAYKNRNNSLQPITLLDVDNEVEHCGWNRQVPENELFYINANFNKNAFELYYRKTLDAYNINDLDRAHSMIKYALILDPNSHNAVSFYNHIVQEMKAMV